MHANFFTEVSNLGTKGQSIGVTCRAVALRRGGFALFAGCFVPQKRSRGVPSFTAAPKNSAHLSRFWVVRTVSANGAGSCKPGHRPREKFPQERALTARISAKRSATIAG